MGNPKKKVPFLCLYPEVENIPKVAWEDYSIEPSDNLSINPNGRFHSMYFKLLNSNKKSLKISGKHTITLIMKLKVIPSFEVNDKTKTKIKE